MKSLLLALLLIWPLGAVAALPPAALNSAGVTLEPGARLPLSLSAPDLSGRRESFRSALAGKPGFVLFADYTCKTLCGPALVLLSAAMTQSAVAPDSWRLVVIGLDPKDTAADARRMMLAEVPPILRRESVFLLPDSKTVAAAATALGFHYAYDKSVDQFAHPEVVYGVAPDGHVLHLLSPLNLTAADIRSAISGTPEPPQTLYASFRVLCYRFGILSGIYDAPAELALKMAALLTMAAMAAAFVLLIRRKHSPWK
jgi:protein SCO1/2